MTGPRRDTVLTVLARVRKALRAGRLFSHPEGIVMAGDAERYGTTGPFELHVDSAGRFRLLQGGPLPETVCFDGRTGWATDWSGMPRRLEHFDLESARLDAEVLSGRWLLPGGFFGATLAACPADSPTERLLLTSQEGRLTAEMAVSRTTWLPVTLRRVSLTGDERWGFRGWRESWGLMVPSRVVVKTGRVVSRSYVVRAVAPSARPPGRWYAEPEPPDDVRFDPKASPRLVVRRGLTGHVATPVVSIRRDAGLFVLDTGAGGAMLVDPKIAGRIGGEVVGSTLIAGVFGTVRAPVRRGAPLTIGPLTLERPYFVEMDLSFMNPLFPEGISGIIGWDLFSRCVAQIELGKDRVSLHARSRYALGEGQKWQRLQVHVRHPVVPAKYEGGRSGLFRLDLGAAGGAFGNVTFHAPTVVSERLLSGRELLPGNVGRTPVFFGRIATFGLLARRFANVNAVFAQAKHGAFSDPYTAGNIGVNVLSYFRLVLDVGGRRVSARKAEPAAGEHGTNGTASATAVPAAPAAPSAAAG